MWSLGWQSKQPFFSPCMLLLETTSFMYLMVFRSYRMGHSTAKAVVEAEAEGKRGRGGANGR